MYLMQTKIICFGIITLCFNWHVLFNYNNVAKKRNLNNCLFVQLFYCNVSNKVDYKWGKYMFRWGTWREPHLYSWLFLFDVSLLPNISLFNTGTTPLNYFVVNHLVCRVAILQRCSTCSWLAWYAEHEHVNIELDPGCIESKISTYGSRVYKF